MRSYPWINLPQRPDTTSYLTEFFSQVLSRGRIINTEHVLHSNTHYNTHVHLNGTSLPRNIHSLVTPPTHSNDTVLHTYTQKTSPSLKRHEIENRTCRWRDASTSRTGVSCSHRLLQGDCSFWATATAKYLTKHTVTHTHIRIMMVLKLCCVFSMVRFGGQTKHHIWTKIAPGLKCDRIFCNQNNYWSLYLIFTKKKSNCLTPCF